MEVTRRAEARNCYGHRNPPSRADAKANFMRPELVQAWDTLRFEQRAEGQESQLSEHAAAATCHVPRKGGREDVTEASDYAEEVARARRVPDVGSQNGGTEGKTRKEED